MDSFQNSISSKSLREKDFSPAENSRQIARADSADSELFVELSAENEIVARGKKTKIFGQLFNGNSPMKIPTEISFFVNPTDADIFTEDLDPETPGIQTRSLSGAVELQFSPKILGEISIAAAPNFRGAKISEISPAVVEFLFPKVSAVEILDEFDGAIAQKILVEIFSPDEKKVKFSGAGHFLFSDSTAAGAENFAFDLIDGRGEFWFLQQKNHDDFNLQIFVDGAEKTVLNFGAENFPNENPPAEIRFSKLPEFLPVGAAVDFSIKFFDANSTETTAPPDFPEIEFEIQNCSDAKIDFSPDEKTGKIFTPRDGCVLQIVATAGDFSTAAAAVVGAKISNLNGGVFTAISGGDFSPAREKTVDEILFTGSGLGIFAQTLPTEIFSPVGEISPIGKVKLPPSFSAEISNFAPPKFKIFDREKFKTAAEIIPEFSDFNFENLTDANLSAEKNSAKMVVFFDDEKVAEISREKFEILRGGFSFGLDAESSPVAIFLKFENEPVGRISFSDLKLNFEKVDAEILSPNFADGFFIFGETKTEFFEKFTAPFSNPDFGFEDSDRANFGLLFAAGNSAGNSVRAAISPAAEFFGDPTISLPPADFENPDLKNFDRTVGEQIFFDETFSLQQIIPADFDRDGEKDLILIGESGVAKFLKNTAGKFSEVGDVFADASKFQKVGAAEENFTAIADDEFIFFKNLNEEVFRRKFPLQKNFRNFLLDDFDEDGQIDLLAFESSGDLSIFFGRGESFDFEQKFLLKNFAVEFSDQNFSDDIFISPPENFTNENIPGGILLSATKPPPEIPAPTLENLNELPESISPENFEFTFFPISQNSFLQNPRKVFLAENDNLQNGDSVFVEISFQNSTQKKQTFSFADENWPFLEILSETLVCENCGENWWTNFPGATSDFLQILNLEVPAGKKAQISFRTKFTGAPNLNLETVVLPDSKFKSIRVSLDSQSLFFENLGDRKFTQKVLPPPDLPKFEPATNFTDADGNGTPDKFEIDENENSIPDFAEEFLNSNSADDDGDGIPNVWDSFNLPENSEENFINRGENLDKKLAVNNISVNRGVN